jgi:TolA-binding protein
MKLSRHVWLIAAALAACSSPVAHWEKAGANEAAAQADSEQCRVKARDEAPQPHAFAVTGATDRVLTLEERREQNELEYFQKCMREKGYSAKR